MILPHILDAIGETPVVRLSRLFPAPGPEVYAKLELLNPGGSVKDRPARHLIAQGLADGSIPPDAHIIESSSGNMAIALAMVCRMHGLRFTAVVDPLISPANLKIIRCLGAGIEWVEEKDAQGGYLRSRIMRIKRLLRQHPDLIWVNQYGNARNWESHYRGEAEELLRDFRQPAQVLVLGVSTAGTLHGIARRLREAWPGLRVVAVDAFGSVIFGTPPRPRELPGIGATRVPDLLRAEEVDEVIHIDDFEAARGCRRLVQAEGIFAGGSSGAVIAATQALGERLPPATRILTLLPDRGERYLETVYDDDWLARARERHRARLAAIPEPAFALPGEQP